ncbi:hypothetical protein DEA8626_03380 [Defluviimonas aquaemixtae]|uniref:DUF2189 domain-containing protein n=1 Tax=Albidovulum aquaemixtae TaxID=1542388 RepID=A0A2R8BLM1_9RHOB|nr:DUF2189 domain-containing protein [Defluviimonas aquaemixtae]SPH24329.1 hypothetical protein DEA8626_03380 [Defluviimonas aquaemixtae]
MVDSVRGPDPLPDIRRVEFSDIGAVFRRGLRDFLRAPWFGIFFSAVYVAGGIVLFKVYTAAGQQWWLAPVVLGFPLIAPFAAVGLYEVSRRIETGEPLGWGDVLSVVFAQRDRQIPAMAAVVIVIFLFWVFIAHALFALFIGLRAFTSGLDFTSLFLSGNGPILLLVGSVIGACFASVLFAVTVCGLPLLLEKEIDFVTAMIHSTRAVLDNLRVMALWGIVIAGLLFLGMLPMFLGLFVVLPILGHATWHMYRRLMGPD